ncbi:MAG TPA: DoxX family membrane protein [Candidatus Nanoarchaeia archaeon]|nr:DoxX family membrane protein [Candidatus Nanoarchaeia archaeon]
MKSSALSFFLVRLGLGIVFLVFGIGKFSSDIWAGTMRNLPALQSLPLSIDVLVMLAGIVEVIISLLLILGLFTRAAAFAASLWLAAIIILLQFSEVREIALLASAIGLALAGSSFLSLDSLLKRA